MLVKYETVIVLEDDLKTTPNFLNYMNEALNKYSCDQSVFSICGYAFDLKNNNYSYDAYFLNRPWPWSWATWADRWHEIDWDVKDYSTFINDKSAQREFAKGGSDLNDMLKRQMNGQMDSWAIRWTYHQFKVGGISLFPTKSKVFNLGFDEFATHTTGSSNRYTPNLDDGQHKVFNFPSDIYVTPEFQKKLQIKMGYFARAKSKIQTYFNLISGKKMLR